MLAPRTVIVIALITGICLLGDSALYVLLPAHLEIFAVSPTAAGLILGINRYIRIISNSGTAWVVHRVGAVWPLVAAVILAGVTTLAYGLTTGFLLLFITHGFWGVSWSVLRLTGYLAAVETGGSNAVGRHMGVFQSISRGGSLIAVVGGGMLADRIGARDTFIVFGAITFAGVALVPFAGIPMDFGRKQDEEMPPKAGQPSVNATTFQVRILYALALVAWLVVSGLTATVGYIVATQASGGISAFGIAIGVSTFSGILLGVRWVTDLGLGPVFGHLSDLMGRQKMVVGAMGFFVVAYTTLAFSPSMAVLTVMFSIVFIGSSALMISLNASIAESAPTEKRAMIIGRYTTWADIGSGTGPIVALPMLTNIGSAWTYGSAAVVVVIAAIAYWVVFVER
jgi:MFS family permease